MKMELSREVLHYSILRFRRIFLNMFLDRRKALSTDIVLDTARVLESCLFTDSEVHQPFGEGRVALIDRLGDPAAFVGQCNVLDFQIITPIYWNIMQLCAGNLPIKQSCVCRCQSVKRSLQDFYLPVHVLSQSA